MLNQTSLLGSLCLLLITFPIFAQAPDSYEPNEEEEDAFELSFDFDTGNPAFFSLEATIHQPGDVDHYRLIALPGYDYEVMIDRESGIGDSEYGYFDFEFLYRTSGEDWQYGGYYSSSSVVLVPAGDTLWLQIKGYDDALVTEPYRLDFSVKRLERLAPDGYEENDELAQATLFLPAPSDGSVRRWSTEAANLHWVDDIDFYQVVLPDRGGYRLDGRLQDAGSSDDGAFYTTDAVFYYLHPNGWWSNFFDNEMDAPITAAGGDTLYFVVSAANDAGNGTYALELTMELLVADPYEYNDEPEEAYPIYLERPEASSEFITISEATLHYKGDEDYFRLPLPAGSDYLLDIGFTTSTGFGAIDYQAWVQKEGELVDFQEGFSRGGAVSGGDTLLLRGYAPGGDVVGSYRLDIHSERLVPGMPDPYEENDSEASAALLGYQPDQDLSTESANLHSLTDKDYYQIDFPEGYNYMVNSQLILPNESGGLAEGAVRLSAKTPGGEWRVLGTQRTELLVQGGQALWLEVFSPTNDTGAYRLELFDIQRLPEIPADNYEINDQLAAATLLPFPSGQELVQTMLVEATLHEWKDLDYYAVALPAGREFIVSAKLEAPENEANPGPFDLRLNLLRMVEGESQYSYEPGVIRVPAGLSPDTVFLEVHSGDYYSNYLGAYHLRLTVDGLPEDPYEPNDNEETAYELPLEFNDGIAVASTPGAALRGGGDDVDYYRIVVPEGGMFLAKARWYDADYQPEEGRLLSGYARLIYRLSGEDYYDGYYQDHRIGPMLVMSGDTINFLIEEDYYQEGQGSYRLDIQLERVEADSYEQNDVLPEAATLPLEFVNDSLFVGSTNGATLHNAGDRDFYRLALPESDFGYAMSIEAFDGANPIEDRPLYGNVNFRLRVGNGSWLAGTYQSRQEVFVDGGAELIVEVYHDGNDYVKRYELEVKGEQYPPDPYEVNDTEGQAAALSTSFVDGRALVNPPQTNLHRTDDVDYYLLELPPGSQYLVSREHSGNYPSEEPELDIAIRLVGGAWQPVSEPVSLEGGGPLLVRVFPRDWNEIGAYQLGLALEKLDPDPYENNDMEATAYEWGSNSEANRTELRTEGANLHGISDLDFFAVPLEAGIYQVDLDFEDRYTAGWNEAPAFSADIAIDFRFGNSDWERYDNNYFYSFPETVVGPDTLFLRVRPGQSEIPGSYRLSIAVDRLSNDPYEENGSLEKAYLLASPAFEEEVDTIRTVGAGIYPAGDEDYFRVILPKGSFYEVGMEVRDAAYYPDDYVVRTDLEYRKANGDWESVYSQNDPLLRIEGGDTLWIRLAGVSFIHSDEIGNYDLLIPLRQKSFLPPDLYEANDVEEDAYQLEARFLQNRIRLSTPGATLHRLRDVDHYQVILPEGFNYRVKAAVDDQRPGNWYGNSIRLQYKDPDEGLFLELEDATSFNISGGDTLIVRLADAGSGTPAVGDYLLELTIDQLPLPLPDPYEDNNQAANAFPLPIAFTNEAAFVTTEGAGIHLGGDRDYYYLALPGGFDYQAGIQLQDAAFMTKGQVYSADVRVAYRRSGDDWSEYSDTGPAETLALTGGDTLWLEVRGISQTTTGNYAVEVVLHRQEQEAVVEPEVPDIDAVFPDRQPAAPYIMATSFPNPATDWVDIEVKGIGSTSLRLDLITHDGRLIEMYRTEAVESEHRFRLPVAALPPGVYYYRIRSGEQWVVGQFVVR